MYTNEEEIIQPDEQQDYKLTTVDVKRDKVIIEFERSYETDDVNDYSIDVSMFHYSLLIITYNRAAQFCFDMFY